MASVTKNEVLNNATWRFAERILAQIITTVVSVVLARILSPEDYGAIAIIMIFINICNVFVSKGFNSSLIQKKDADEIDFSTAFYINFIITIVLFLGICFLAPVIADFYGIPILSPLLRVMAIKLPFTAVNSVQNAMVSRNMQFKKYFFATIGGTLISAGVGIGMAYAGYGVWALAGQYLSSTAINSVILWFTVKWRPRLVFSIERAKGLFSYGWKILVSSLLDEVNTEVTSFAIGKKYSSADLAYYSKGKQFPNIINVNVNTTISSIMFSVLSKDQTEMSTFKSHMKRSLKTSTFVMFPLLLGMAAVSEEFLILLLTEKWAAAVPFMQIFCISCLFYPINSLNIQAVKATGASGKYLLMTFIKTLVSVGLVLIAIPFGVHWVAMVGILNAFVASLLQALPLKRLVGYSFWQEIKDVLPNLILAIVMMCAASAIGFMNLPLFASFTVKIAVGILVYLGGAKLFKNESLDYLYKMLMSKLKRRKSKTNKI